jgi:hypothetical protein
VVLATTSDLKQEGRHMKMALGFAKLLKPMLKRKLLE